MNIFEMMKQLKSVQDSMNKLKEELQNETVTYEDENYKITATLVGEVVDIQLKKESCKDLEENLKKAFKELHKMAKERVKEKTKSSLFGNMGLF